MNEEKVINKYVFLFDEEGYLSGFYTVTDGSGYDFEGQMADYPEATEGWYKFEDGSLYVDEAKKEEIIKERERQEALPTRMDILEAQATYTALMTDTLIDSEEEGE